MPTSFGAGVGQIKTGWRGACERAGIAKAKPHDLRHTWASWFYALSKDPMLLKAEGGWKSLDMVERYAHLIPSAMEADGLTGFSSGRERLLHRYSLIQGWRDWGKSRWRRWPISQR